MASTSMSWLDLHRGDAEVAGLATFAIRCMAVNLVLNALIEAYINFLQATSQMLKTYIVNVLSRFACVVICAFALGGLFGINGVWLAFPVGSAVLIAAVVAAMVRKRTIKIGPNDILGLPGDFGAAPEDTLWFNVGDKKPDYSAMKNGVYGLCEKHGFDRRKAYRAALCLEEMARRSTRLLKCRRGTSRRCWRGRGSSSASSSSSLMLPFVIAAVPLSPRGRLRSLPR